MGNHHETHVNCSFSVTFQKIENVFRLNLKWENGVFFVIERSLFIWLFFFKRRSCLGQKSFTVFNNCLDCSARLEIRQSTRLSLQELLWLPLCRKYKHRYLLKQDILAPPNHTEVRILLKWSSIRIWHQAFNGGNVFLSSCHCIWQSRNFTVSTSHTS